MNFILERLKERSTWLGLVTLATSIGVNLNPDLVMYITSIGTGVAGLILFLTKDKPPGGAS